MIFILGGCMQGRLAFAKARFSLTEGDCFLCSDASAEIDFTRRCIAYVDRAALRCVRMGKDPCDLFKADPGAWAHSIIIATDISGGIVPADPVLRAWREANGQMNIYLAGQADEVWRLFCGIPQRLK